MALPVIGNIVKLRLGKKILNLRRYLNKKTALLFWNYSSSQWLLFVILRGAFYIIEDYSAMFLWCNSLLDRILSYVFLVGIIHVKRRIKKKMRTGFLAGAHSFCDTFDCLCLCIDVSMLLFQSGISLFAFWIEALRRKMLFYLLENVRR